MKPAEIQVRRDICSDCKRECDVRATITHADPSAGCPSGVWHAFGDRDPEAKAPMRGLGDLVHVVALPIARALRLPCVDPATKQLRPNSPCAGRIKSYNRAVPFKAQS